jgi:hypothetical protein
MIFKERSRSILCLTLIPQMGISRWNFLIIRQTQLYNILRAFAIKNKDVGYCQGMGFISAIFLTYMDEEVKLVSN